MFSSPSMRSSEPVCDGGFEEEPPAWTVRMAPKVSFREAPLSSRGAPRAVSRVSSVRVVGREESVRCAGARVAELFEGLDAVRPGHLQIQEYHIGVEAFCEPYHFVPVRGFAYHLEVGWAASTATRPSRSIGWSSATRSLTLSTLETFERNGNIEARTHVGAAPPSGPTQHLDPPLIPTMPCRSSATLEGSKPWPSSLTMSCTASGVATSITVTRLALAWLAMLVRASWQTR